MHARSAPFYSNFTSFDSFWCSKVYLYKQIISCQSIFLLAFTSLPKHYVMLKYVYVTIAALIRRHLRPSYFR